MEKEIFDRTKNLINHSSSSGETTKLAGFGATFRHKVNSIRFHFNLIKSVKRQTDAYVETAHQNKIVLFGEPNLRNSFGVSHELEFKYTTLMEDLIYHTMSAIDNLPIVLSIYYKPVNPMMTFNSARSALKQTHTKDLEITKHIGKGWDDWIERLHDFRADIYHHHSKICAASMTVSFGKKESGEQFFDEKFIITLPEKMREALNYPADKKVEIEEFCVDIMNKSFTFFEEVLDIVAKDQMAKKTNGSSTTSSALTQSSG